MLQASASKGAKLDSFLPTAGQVSLLSMALEAVTIKSVINKLKTVLTTASALGFLDFALPFILEVANELEPYSSRFKMGKRRVLAYTNHTLRPTGGNVKVV